MANQNKGLVPMAIGIVLSLATIYAIAFFASKGFQKGKDA
jgi:hypothetical protein